MSLEALELNSHILKMYRHCHVINLFLPDKIFYIVVL